MRLWSTTIGNGPKRAALIHGITGDGGTWFELAPWIAAQGYTVTLIDQRGHGRSKRASSYSSAELADDLVESLPRGLDLIAGHSLGGRSLTLAVDRLLPKRAIYLDPGWVIPEDLVVTRPLRADGSLMNADELAEMIPTISRAHLEQALRANAHFDPAVMAPPNFPLPTIVPADAPAVPSLVVVADPSPVVPLDLQERLRAGGYVVHVVPGGRHDLHIENLQETKQVLAGWL